MKLIFIIIVLGIIGLAGCGGSESEPAADSIAESIENETVFDPLLETLDKAKAVEGLEADRKRRIDEQLEQN